MFYKQNDSELVVYFKNGSLLQLKGADNPDSLRGANPCGVVLDEFATMKKEAWYIIEPIIRQNNGWAWFIGTPHGKNHLYEFYQRGLAGHEEWWSSLLKADETGIFTPSQLNEAKKSMTQSMYGQEMMCDFLETEGVVFRNVRQAAVSMPAPPVQGHLYVIGVDLAKVQDWTVVTVYDRQNNNQVFQDRFNQLEWPFQKRKIAAISKHYNNGLVRIDATGLGDPIADDLRREGLAVEPIKFTEQSKKELVEKLSIWLELGKIKILPIEETIQEFENFSYEIGPTGKIRYNAREGFHDDIVFAHALAVGGLADIPRLQLPDDLSPLQRTYRELTGRIPRQQQAEENW
jgi:hypothetical protein